MRGWARALAARTGTPPAQARERAAPSARAAGVGQAELPSMDLQRAQAGRSPYAALRVRAKRCGHERRQLCLELPERRLVDIHHMAGLEIAHRDVRPRARVDAQVV